MSNYMDMSHDTNGFWMPKRRHGGKFYRVDDKSIAPTNMLYKKLKRVTIY